MVRLLTPQERALLPMVIAKRQKFQNIIGRSIENLNEIFSNCIFLQGKAGSGKTTLVLNYLEKLKKEEKIGDYVRASGHVTPRALYHLMKNTSYYKNGLPQVLVLDDCDECLSDQGCLELMKAGFDTKSNAPTNRRVYYMTDTSTGFEYNGFGIIITNKELDSENATVHQQALMDRVQAMSCDLQPEDMMVYTAYLVEDFLNKNEDHLTDNEIAQACNLFENEIRTWMKNDTFKRSGINFSIRLIKKFIDSSRIFKEDWKSYNTQYQKLQLASEMAEVTSHQVNTIVSVNPILDIKNGIPVVDTTIKKVGKYYINPRNGKPYSRAWVYELKKQGKLA